MRSVPRLIGAGGLLAVAVTLGLPQVAAADTGPAFRLEAQGQGLQITLAGTTLVGGTSSASAGTASPTVADGDGVLTPVVTSSAHASVSAAGADQRFPQSCGQPSVPFPAPFSSLISLGVACAGATAAEDDNGLPSAVGTGEVASLELSPSASALPVPVDPGSALAAALAEVFGDLPPLPSGGSSLDTVLAALAQAANTQLAYLVKVAVGSSSSSVSATASSATASTQDAAVTISLLGGLGSGGGPLATITIGSAVTTTTLDRSTGAVTAGDTPALVTVQVAPPIGSPESLTVAPGVSQTILAGTPLETEIAVGTGSAEPGSSQGTSSADGVVVDALSGLGATDAAGSNGGIGVSVASSSSGAAGTTTQPTPAVVASTSAATVPPPVAVQTVSAPVAGVTTVHTGAFWAGRLPLVIGAASLLTGMALLWRPRRRFGWPGQVLQTLLARHRRALER